MSCEYTVLDAMKSYIYRRIIDDMFVCHVNTRIFKLDLYLHVYIHKLIFSHFF